MKLGDALVTLGAGAALGGGAWALVRAETARQTAAAISANDAYRIAATFKGLRLPPPAVLAASMVPLIGMNSPYQAAEDIKRKGRASKYWPADYREPSQLGEIAEARILALGAALADALAPR